MADLGTLTTYPGQIEIESGISTVQFCRLEVLDLDLDGEDEDATIEDLHPPSIYEHYSPPTVEYGGYEEDEEDGEDAGNACIGLTFYTEGGEVSRYITDSECDDIYEVFAEVLAAMGQRGWQAVNIITDPRYEETWFLQRFVNR
jgi:hypothetical protein